MRFYEITGSIKKIDHEYDEKAYRNIDEFVRKSDFDEMVFDRTKKYNNELKGKAFITISHINSQDMMACVLVDKDINLQVEVNNFLEQLGIMTSRSIIKETTFNNFQKLLDRANRKCYISDDDEILNQYGLYEISKAGRFLSGIEFEEKIIDIPTKKNESIACNRLLTANHLLNELDRIRMLKNLEKVQGHPVHYIIQTDDKEVQKTTLNILLGNLFKNDRIHNKRICGIDCTNSKNKLEALLSELYKMNEGGTVVAFFKNLGDFDDKYAIDTLKNIEALCENMNKYRNSVLTVLVLPKECTQLKNHLFENLGCLSFVEIEEQPAGPKQAKQFLRLIAKDNNVPVDKKLYSRIEKEETYYTSELRTIFEDWFSKKLRTEVYPQYSQFQMVRTEEARKDDKGNAHDKLMSMVGLKETKKLINQAIDFHRMQKFLAAQDIVRERPSQHMVFTGNPGTAKTTVARLFAKIMRENELLSSGHIVEVGRADLVGKYVGHTAPLVKKCFNLAKGGVLFIDEAYSLIDDRDGCFGDEAINTIVQEMENNRDNLVVIFAGYPDKMEQFLAKNPGLRSRIAFHVSFPDYDPQELCEIALLIIKQKGMKLTDNAYSKLLDIFQRTCTEGDFGNGRFARSVIEKAIMAQSSRIIKKDLESLTKAEINTIHAEDIDVSCLKCKKHSTIGFCA